MKLKFKTSYQWQHDNIGQARLEGKPVLDISPPPEFRGPQGYWTPEDLFVSAVETCLFLTFLGLIKKEGITLLDYSSEAVGLLERTEKGLAFTRIDIYPVMEVEDNVPLATELIERAEKHCLVANSLAAEVHVSPQVLQAHHTEEV